MESIPQSKTCTRCGYVFPTTKEFFRTDKRTKDKLTSACKGCLSADEKAIRVANPEHFAKRAHDQYKKHRQKRVAYRQENIGKIRAQKREWRRLNPDKVKAQKKRSHERNRDKNNERTNRWIKANQDYVNQERRRYYQENKQKIADYHREYYRTPEGEARIKERAKQWARDNVERVRTNAKVGFAKRRARIKELPDMLTDTEWETCLKYFNGKCAVCGRGSGTFATISADHWIALNDSRLDNPGTVALNIVPLCHAKRGGVNTCNNSKGDRDAILWLIQRYGAVQAQEIVERIEVYFQWLATR